VPRTGALTPQGACVCVCAQGLVVDVEAFGTHVRGTPGMLERLQRVCTPLGQAQLLENAREVGADAHTHANTFCGSLARCASHLGL